ncbi:hypothetical protein SAMN05216466_104459 [Paraburkholderia phenazinium]|uniref:Uncharacterized protein n=1 Tax=Paraburkholderia phenazinium TaxID=60549 RepID=A0A1G7W997_9BURK|nr:hypothetical protein SAMN05216466_104459 [Paraburkholderia phenazinium]
MRGNLTTGGVSNCSTILPVPKHRRGGVRALVSRSVRMCWRTVVTFRLASTRPVLAVVVLMSMALPARPVMGAELESLQVEPGVPVEQSYGVMGLRFMVERQAAALNVSISLDGQEVGEQTLTPFDNIYLLDMRMQQNGVEGSLVAHFGMAGEVSSLEGDFTVTQCQGPANDCKAQQVRYRREFANWVWTTPVMLKHWTVWLTPELNAEITLQFIANQNVEVKFLTAGQFIRTTSLSEGANSSRFPQGAMVGTVSIAPDMVVTLRPATPVQMGEVTLRGRFSSSDHHSVKYDGTLAAWRYLAPQARGMSP